ncbi:phage terminase large subunit GpA [Selenomonas sp. FOBRC9]|uniref:phage terminase large subunit family protein n=1 Tax=Selenomonas sp. FOBRC9 TaxID=936573 RepID=UPI00027A3DD7|nr:terminase gpA endonuclease subunit [Selenomonas sp. FOBRC9]EJP28302.1 phage terminase large subunit GpA [Selenomonas sp. FOBRC9]
MKTAIDLWRIVSQKGLTSLPKTTVSTWADDYRILSNTSAEPGRWKTSRAPYQEEIMNAFTQPGIRRVVVMSSSQVGKSDIMNNVIGRFAHLDPCAIMMIQPTIEMAQDYSKTRISPMIRDTKALSRIFYDVKDGAQQNAPKTRDGNNTILSKIFPGGRLIMCGANSPAGLASRPIRILLADEVDRFPESAGTEGDPVDLASKRMTTFWNRVMGLFSTPTIEGSSRIAAEYQAGTQEEWQHECPNCKEYHTIRYTNIHAKHTEHKDVQGRKIVIIEDVKWRCTDCGFSFDEKTMKAAPQKYVAQNPVAVKNGIRSFFVNAFSSPWMTWSEIMREWHEALGDPTREQVIVNTRFGEPYQERGAFDDGTVFLQRREQYGAELPNGVLMLTAAVDVQDNRLEYEICGWGEAEESWGILYGVIPGTPDQWRTWEMLDEVLDRTYFFRDGSGLNIVRSFIDSGGHYTGNVYAYCQRNYHKQRIPIKGKGGPGIPLVYKIGKAQGASVPLVLLGVDDGKQQVMNRLSIDAPGASYFHFPLDGDERLPYRGYDQIYFRGIISEHKKQVRRNGALRTIWETTKGVRNEPLDLRVYNLACMLSCTPDWAHIKAAMRGEEAPQTQKKKNTAAKRTTQTARQTNIW